MPPRLQPTAPASRPRSGRLAALLDDAPYTGLQNQSIPELASEEVRTEENGLQAKGGLPPLEAAARLGALPGLEVQPEGDNGMTLTFHRPGGEAIVEIGQRHEGATTRMGALVVLVLAGVVGGWLVRRNRLS